MVLACVIASVAATVGAPNVAAKPGTASNPEELWRAYPLEQAPTTGGGTPARSPAPRPGTGSSSPEAREEQAPATGPSWIAVLAATAGGAVLVLLGLLFRGRLVSLMRGLSSGGSRGPAAPGMPREAERRSAVPAAAAGRSAPQAENQGEAVAPGRAARGTTERSASVKSAPPSQSAVPEQGDPASVAGRAAQPSRRVKVSAGSAPPAAAPPAPTQRAPEREAADSATSPGRRSQGGAESSKRERRRTTGARKGTVCQIRWRPGRRGSRFYAVTTDPDGVEQKIAQSLPFEWRGPSPPEQTPEAQAALRHLAKEIRSRGWRPLRAKGKDFNEHQWYARRFRQPAGEPEAEDKGERRVQQGVHGAVGQSGGEHLERRAQP